MARRERHIVVTGAGTGIGRAIALRLAAKGAKLTLLARDAKRLEETAVLARKKGALAQCLACDIRKRAKVDESFAAAAKRFGPIHVLIANAGIGGANVSGKRDRFDELVATNLTGTYSCLRAAERHLDGGPGVRHLVVTSSILARIGVQYYSGYCASKAGLLGLVRALAVELAPKNVQVNAICPGWVDTEMAREGIEVMARGMNVTAAEAREIAMQQVPLRRMSQPAEIAGLVAWLVSDDARGVTGQGLDINNGAFLH